MKIVIKNNKSCHKLKIIIFLMINCHIKPLINGFKDSFGFFLLILKKWKISIKKRKGIYFKLFSKVNAKHLKTELKALKHAAIEYLSN